MHRSDERLAWAEAKLRECAPLALRYAARPPRIELKADRSPVTIADRRLEERLRRELSRAFPGEAVIGEEFGAPTHRPRSFWTIDPIDGTRAFSRGLPSWGMLVSYIEEGVPVVGACLYPVWNTFLGVGPATPAFERVGMQRRRLPRARAMTDLSRAVIFHGGSGWWFKTSYVAGFRRLVQACYLERAYGDCYGYLWAFRGRVDAVIDCGVKIWDVAPMAALALSTGRTLVNFDNRVDCTGPNSIVAHPSLARLIARTLSTSSP